MSSFKLTVLEEESPDLLKLLEQSQNPKLARLRKSLSTNIKAHNTRKDNRIKLNQKMQDYMDGKRNTFSVR